MKKIFKIKYFLHIKPSKLGKLNAIEMAPARGLDQFHQSKGTFGTLSNIKVGAFTKIVSGFQLFTIFANISQ